MAARETTGIRARHSRACESASGGARKPAWEASVTRDDGEALVNAMRARGLSASSITTRSTPCE
jgi:hypothetical protein